MGVLLISSCSSVRHVYRLHGVQSYRSTLPRRADVRLQPDESQTPAVQRYAARGRPLTLCARAPPLRKTATTSGCYYQNGPRGGMPDAPNSWTVVCLYVCARRGWSSDMIIDIHAQVNARSTVAHHIEGTYVSEGFGAPARGAARSTGSARGSPSRGTPAK